MRLSKMRRAGACVRGHRGLSFPARGLLRQCTGCGGCVSKAKLGEDLAQALKECGTEGAGEVDLTVGGHEKEDGLEHGIFFAECTSRLEVFIDQVFDGVTEDLESMAGV